MVESQNVTHPNKPPMGIRRLNPLRPGRFVVSGPPASGKSTWIEGRRRPGDLIWDFDVVASAVTRCEMWNRPPEAVDCVTAMRQAFVEWACSVSTNSQIFVIAGNVRSGEFVSRKIGAELIVLRTPRVVCIQRIQNDPARAARRAEQLQAVDDWFGEFGAKQ